MDEGTELLVAAFMIRCDSEGLTKEAGIDLAEKLSDQIVEAAESRDYADSPDHTDTPVDEYGPVDEA